jgi:hypothetical protein
MEYPSGSTPGQSLFFLGILLIIIGGMVWFFFGCDRYIKPYCIEEDGNWDFYWIGLAILGAGALMFIIGWLVMKEEKVDEPAPSRDV